MVEETESTALSFVVADDHPMVRDALGQALRSVFQGLRIHAVADLVAAERAVVEHDPVDLAILDIDMPGMNGLAGLSEFRARHPTVPVVVLSALRDPGAMRRAVDLGASAFIPKSAPLEQIASTIRAVLDGEIFLPPEATAPHPYASTSFDLTPQQWRVLSLMREGKLNKQIAHELSIGEATVKAHVTTILRKLGVRSRTQAVIEAQRLDLDPGKGAN
jgi:DNA-binding NarL/FixJ family response regulator